jgi:type III secretory pathway component EscR
MNIPILKNYLGILTLFLLIIAAGCKEKNTVGNASMISGNESKTWKTTKETTAAGDKDKLTKEEKNQEIQFFANGSFSMRSATENASGKWTYDAMAKNLTLQFVGSDMTENFQVLSLSNDEMKLQAGDGSQMNLETD